MYTVKIKSVEKQKATTVVQIVAVFTDTVTNDEVEKLITMPYGFTLPTLKKALRDYKSMLETTDEVVVSIPLNEEIDLAIPKVDKDKKDLREAMREIAEVQDLVKLGILTEAEGKVKTDTLQATARQIKTKLD